MHLSNFYKSAVQSCDDHIRTIRGRTSLLSVLRLLLFAAFVYCLYSLAHDFSPGLLGLLILLAALFIFSVNFYFKLKDQLALWEKLRFVNLNEIDVLAGEPNKFPDGLRFLDPDN